MGSGSSTTLTFNPQKLSLPPTPPSKKKQILKDDDTLGGVGFGDTSFLVLMTKVKEFCYIYWLLAFFLLQALLFLRSSSSSSTLFLPHFQPT